jgi:hypothetical protein
MLRAFEALGNDRFMSDSLRMISPRTEMLSFSFNRGGTPFMRATLAVIRSPIWPSPRVIASVRTPSS